MKIHNAGGISVELPTIEIHACNQIWLESIKKIDDLQQIIFISKNSVRYFFAGLEKENLRLPKNILVTCIGPGTADLLTKYNIKANYIPTINTSEHLLELPNLHNVFNENILLVKGIGGRNTISKELQRRGANLTIVEVYERELPKVSPLLIDTIWREDTIDIIIYTSKQAMLNTLDIFPYQAKPWLLAKPCVVISKRLAKHANELGFKNIIQASYTDITEAIEGLKL